MTRPTRATRELACLALGHDDADAASCPSSDDDLLRSLVVEVQRLRLVAGEVEETSTDRAEATGALDDALAETAGAWETTGPEYARGVLDRLADGGYRLVPAPRP